MADNEKEEQQLKLPANIRYLEPCGIQPWPGKLRDYSPPFRPHPADSDIDERRAKYEAYKSRWREYHLLKKQKEYEEYKNTKLEVIIEKTRTAIKDLTDLSQKTDAELAVVSAKNLPLDKVIEYYDLFMDRFSQHYVMDAVLLAKDGPAIKLEDELDKSLAQDLKYSHAGSSTYAIMRQNIINNLLDGKGELPENVRVSTNSYDLAKQLAEIKKLEQESQDATSLYFPILTKVIGAIDKYSYDLLKTHLSDNPFEIDAKVQMLKQHIPRSAGER
jgi:hypothetical protein